MKELNLYWWLQWLILWVSWCCRWLHWWLSEKIKAAPLAAIVGAISWSIFLACGCGFLLGSVLGSVVQSLANQTAVHKEQNRDRKEAVIASSQPPRPDSQQMSDASTGSPRQMGTGPSPAGLTLSRRSIRPVPIFVLPPSRHREQRPARRVACPHLPRLRRSLKIARWSSAW